ncbi:MAG: putative hydrolase YutF [Verrucomicrobiota bacterium]
MNKKPNYGVLIDMDGVIYRGGELIPGAAEFVRQLQSRDVPFMFLTNNSMRTRIDIATKLLRMGIEVDAEHVYTCAMSTARFLGRQSPGATAFVLGESGLTTALNRAGIAVVDKDPDYVIVGEGRTYTFEMLEQATNFINRGARLIATNLDPSCPTDKGSRPGCGAIVRLLEEATGRKAFSLGKPSPIMMRDARKMLGLDATHTFMVGDTMETDIIGGLQLGYHTVLVLSGGTRQEDLAHYAYQPSRVVRSVAELSPSWFDQVIAKTPAITVEDLVS